ncbi:hypothetical protein ACFMKP_11860, partial [Herpetosiphon sp. NSE202]
LETPAPTAPAASSDVPSWMQTDAPAAPVASAGDDVPAWLRGDLETPAPTAPAASSDVPSWMQTDAPASPAAANAGDDVPAWLRGDLADTAQTPPAASGDVPAWLRGDMADAAQTPPVASSDVPSWMQADAPATPPAASAGDDVPAWLRGDMADTAPTPPAASSDVPSWMQADAPATPPAASAGDDVPAWLRGDMADMPQATPTVKLDSTEQDVPAWLKADLDAAPTAPVASGDVPSWLQADAPAAPPAANAGDDVPAWLRGDMADMPQATPTVKLDSTEQDVPAWLKADLDAAPTAPVASGDVPSWLQADAPAVPPVASGDIPSWLQADVADLPPVNPTIKLDSNEQDPNVPAWLNELETPPSAAPTDSLNWMHEEAPTVKLDNQAAGLPTWLQEDLPTVRLDSAASNVPAWLQDDVTPIVPPTKAEPSIPQTPSTKAEAANVPAWLRDDLDIEIPATPATAAPSIPGNTPSWLLDDEPAQAAQDDGLLGSVDLPAWLRQTVKQEESAPVVEPEAAPTIAESADWLRVLGEPEPVVAANAATTGRLLDQAPPALLNRTPERVSAMHLLQDLVTKPLPEPAEVPIVATPPWWQRIGTQRIVAILMLLSLVVGLLVPNLLAINTQALTIGGNTSDLYNYVETLNPESRVLIAYEGDLRHNAELGPLEQSITQHLIDRKVPMLLLSTDTEGSLLASQRAAQFPIIDPTTGYTGEGAEYLNLGWVKGNEVGIAQLGSNLRGTIANLLQNREGADVNLLRIMSKLNSNNQLDRPRITTTRDLDLLIVVADEPSDVQRWMEQFWSREPSLPVAILTTNEVLPQIQPYVDVNVNGNQAAIYTAAGLVGEQQYTALRSIDTTSNGSINALSLGMITTILVVLVGGVLQLQRRIRGKRNSL